MKRTTMPLARSVLAALLLAFCGSLAIAQEEGKTTPIKGFPDASLTIFPLTVFFAGLDDRSEGERAWAAAYERGYREDKARPFAHTLGLLLEEQGYGKSDLEDCDRVVLERFRTELR